MDPKRGAEYDRAPAGPAIAPRGGQASARLAGILGMGAIGQSLVADWQEHPLAAWRLACVCARMGQTEAARSVAGHAVTVLDDCGAMLRLGLDAVVEVAGHRAVHEWGVAILEHGCDLHLLSVGALADAALYERLVAAAMLSGARIVVPSGALGGFDALKALARSRETEVVFRSIKPVAAWRGTPAEDLLDGLVTEQVRIFAGTAREAARLFPRNSNLAASVALAGIGFDATRVELYADPVARGNRAQIVARSPACTLTVELAGVAEAQNAKSSAIVRSSILAALERAESALLID